MALAVAGGSSMAFAADEPEAPVSRPGETPPAAASVSITTRPTATLDLRPRWTVGTTVSSGNPLIAMPAGGRPIRIEPIKSIVEWGVENSSEALAACQRGPYAGATVSAYSAWTSRSNAQPDHCYRF